MNDKAIEPHKGGAITRTSGFAGTSIQTTGGTMETALAERERAKIESQLTLAKRFPRDWDAFRVDIKNEVERDGFAGTDDVKTPGEAWYKLPFGDNVEGFTIRFAEACLRLLGNLDIRSEIVWDDEQKRIIEITVFDFEKNISFPSQISIEKTVEKKKLKKYKDRNGKWQTEEPIDTRVNSAGEEIYIYAIDETTLLRKQNAAKSKEIRNAVLRLVPGSIQAECRKRILEIRHGDAATDPDGVRKRIIDGFAKLNVRPSELTEYLDHDLRTATPAELDHLRGLWEAIKHGKITWHAVISEVRRERGDEEGDNQRRENMSDLTDKLRGHQDAAPPKKEPPSDSTVSQAKQALLEAARGLYGDDMMLYIGKMCAARGTGFTAATDEQCDDMRKEIQRDADKGA